MHDETPIRSSSESNTGDGVGRGSSQQSPLQTRAAFLQNWHWELVVRLNERLCERGSAQHGKNSEAYANSQREWNEGHKVERSLLETLGWLRSFHRKSPFLFFNGNTFAEITRTITDALFAEFPLSRRREAASLAAHYVAGVLDHPSMASGIESLVELMDFQKGDRVCTLKKSLCGEVQKILPDGKIVWKPDNQAMELTALPEGLIRETRV